MLPFANLSGDPQQEYFSDGITDQLITDLSRLPALFVIARNSSFTYKGKAVRELGFSYVLEGSVRKADNQVRISAELLRESPFVQINAAQASLYGLACHADRVVRLLCPWCHECFCRANIVVFGKAAESCKEYLKKGREVYVEGRLRIREDELKDNGGKRQRAEIIASRVQFLGSPPADAKAAAEVNGDLASDEAPF